MGFYHEIAFLGVPLYPPDMSELEDDWSRMIASALEAARGSGRGDVADYLSLRASNDAIRRAGVKWLIETLAGLAAEVLWRDSSATIERIDPHSFSFLGANIVGTRLEIRRGVRCLAAEAGWTRTPTDGFMRGGALAIGRLSHFGMPKANVDLGLTRDGDIVDWVVLEEGRASGPFDKGELMRHVSIFIA
ncbi:MAG TPA: hypothetical protein PKD24_08100 [Pyrinomonadaceae bacterium]|nr:hypothetical protein [Pyrinomonadaceae bacterium]